MKMPKKIFPSKLAIGIVLVALLLTSVAVKKFSILSENIFKPEKEATPLLQSGEPEEAGDHSVRIASEIDGINFKIASRQEVDNNLTDSQFWKGIYEDTNLQKKVIPQDIMIHITDKMYDVNKVIGPDDEYLTSTKVEMDKDNVCHLYIGVSSDYLNGNLSGLEDVLDVQFIRAVWTHSVSPVAQNADLDSILRDSITKSDLFAQE